MITFFKKNYKEENTYLKAIPLVADMHSHILPGIDDGAKNMEQSLTLIGELIDMGYRKLTATPHIMGDFYKNTPAIIHEKLIKVQQAVNQKGWNIELKAAAEYYLDEWFMEKLRREEPLLTFGNGYVLFETSYINPPVQLQEAIFLMKSQNYKPVLAHPERYIYFHENFTKIKELYEMGVLLQININSLSGYYSVPAQGIAEKLVDNRMVHFAGTDCHSLKHIQSLHMAQSKKYYAKLLTLDLLNHIL